MRLITYLFTMVLILSGCSSPSVSTSKKLTTYNQQTKELLVILDFGHLQSAFESVGYQNSTRGKLYQAKDALSNAVEESFKSHGVTAKVEIIHSGLSRDTMLAKAKGARYVLLVSASKFQNSKVVNLLKPNVNLGWTGKMGWHLSFYNFDKLENPESKTIWSANTNLFDFGVPHCGKDEYVACSKELSESIVAQMKKENLID